MTKIAAKNIVNKYRNISRKQPYNFPNIVSEEPTNPEDLDRIDTIETLEDIASL